MSQARPPRNSRWPAWCLVCVVLFFLCPLPASAYVGPGAGFAILSSFWAVLLAFFYSVYSFLTWPFRMLFRLIRNRHAYEKAQVRRMVVLGFDGMDPDLSQRFIAEGRLPNLKRLSEQGTFSQLQTTFPAISPVAWSTFMTGVNPGKHNIYDFLARDLNSYLPFLSSAEIRGPKRSVTIGKYTIPIGRPRIRALRRGTPFWHWLGKAGIFCSVLRVPVTFPPEEFPGVLLSGMCVPDLKGSQGTFCLCTTRQGDQKFPEGGVLVPILEEKGIYRSYVPGPGNPLTKEQLPELKAPFTVRREGEDSVRIEAESETFSLRVGAYSEWIALKFAAALGFSAHGICRFYLKSISPDLEIYVTPVNIDPAHPQLPLSHPITYSVYLARLLGPFATLGLAEDTWALNEEVLDDQAFLTQCYANHEDRERMFFDALEKTQKGLCACVFDTTDRVQHMFWRYLEEGHPAARNTPQEQQPQVIQQLYERVDALIGRVMEQLDDDSLLLVVSDHGFKSFRRCFNLNAWLHQNGYLALREGKLESGDWFEDVDWSRTRAYTMGLNGLFLNLRGRERLGTVEPGEDATGLKKELADRLNGLTDPHTQQVAISGVFPDDSVFAGPYADNAPDLIVGYGEGYRASWDSVMGKVTGAVFEDNLKAWSGDHCVDPRLVPGIFVSNRRFTAEDPAIVDLAPTILKIFGLLPPEHMDGKAWAMQAAEHPESPCARKAPVL